MFLAAEKIQHLNSTVYEGKVIVFATDSEGKIYYTVKQDGFEDNYGSTEVTGWENWEELNLPGLDASKDPQQQVFIDRSVIEKEKAELTYSHDGNLNYFYQSRYLRSCTSKFEYQLLAGTMNPKQRPLSETMKTLIDVWRVLNPPSIRQRRLPHQRKVLAFR